MFNFFKVFSTSSDFYKKYTTEHVISKGTFGSVYKGYRKSDKESFAIKIQINNSVSQHEVQILKKLGQDSKNLCMNIVHAVDFFKMNSLFTP